MLTFSNDADILKYEPSLFGHLHLGSQVLAGGTGSVLSGTQFTAAEQCNLTAVAGAGSVIYLQSDSGSPDGAYEIVSVTDDSHLIVSVLRGDDSISPIAPPGGENLYWRICTYKPQAAEAAFELTAQLGIAPGCSNSPLSADDILEADVLRQAAVFSVISGLYAMLASKQQNNDFWEKSLYYRKLCSAAKGRIRLSIITGSSDAVSITKTGSACRLIRD